MFNFPDREPSEMPPDQSCALDQSEEPNTLEEIGQLMNLTRERVRQIEDMALASFLDGKLRDELNKL